MCHEVWTRQPSTEKQHQIMARTAIFVNKHGRQSEIVLRVKQGDNPTFGFLMPDHHLHPYFQYLVDHPQILNTSDSPKEEDEKSNNLASESGALSLLGSLYGNGDDDDTTLKTEIEETKPVNFTGNATVLPEPEHGGPPPSVGIENKEEIKASFPAVAKEKKPSTVGKSFSGKITAVVASRKKGDSHSDTTEKKQSLEEKTVDLNPSVMEPPSFLKRTIEKIIEFIVRNGKQFEAILINQDRNVGRFPFLLPSNQYNSYYLKTLEEANELKLQGKSLFDQRNDEDHHVGSKKKTENHGKDSKSNELDLAEFSEGGYYDPQKKDKFKMILVGQKKDSQDQSSKPAKQSGLSADEAAAIVLAATRGASPANTFHNNSNDDGPHSSKNSGATTEEAAAIVMAATRGWTHANRQHIQRDEGRTSNLGSLQGSKPRISGMSVSTGLSGSEKRNSRTTTSDVTVATVIAKSVALVASREADSSEAGLTKEEKLKAERLKRAKMFAALIKTGSNCMGEQATSGSNHNGSLEPPTGTDSCTLGLEREGSSAPFAVDASDREYESRKMRYSRSRGHHDDSDEDLKQSRKKRHSSHHNDDQLYKKGRSSSTDKEVRRRHKHHSSSDDEDVQKRSSEHRRRRHRSHYRSSDDDDRELYEKRRRKHRSHTERKGESEVGDTGKSVDSSEGPTASIVGVTDMRDLSTSNDKHPSSAAATATEVPNDLRAKIRAMLLETL